MKKYLPALSLIAAAAVAADAPGWSADVPRLGANGYHDGEGWHEIRTNADTTGLPARFDAVAICRRHEWKGYIQMRSTDSVRDTEPCVSLKPGNDASPIEASDTVFAYSPVPGRTLPVSILYGEQILLTIDEEGAIRDRRGAVLIDATGHMRCDPEQFAAMMKKIVHDLGGSKNP